MQNNSGKPCSNKIPMLVLFISGAGLPVLTGCQAIATVDPLPQDLQKLKALAEAAEARGEQAITAEEIVEKMRDAEMSREGKSKKSLVYTFLRNVVTEDLNSVGETTKRKTKTYRAFSDNRDQVLLKVDGRKPTPKEVEADRKENRKRQRQLLDSGKKGKGDSKIRRRKFDQYRDKFIPRLIGTEKIGVRPNYIVQLVPNPSHKLKSSVVDRMMNQMLAKLWIDQEEFQVTKAEIELTHPISYLVGIAASLRALKFTIHQKRLTPEIWVDQNVSAFIDVRILLGTFHFQMNSKSSGFKPATKRNIPTSDLRVDSVVVK